MTLVVDSVVSSVMTFHDLKCPVCPVCPDMNG